MSECIKEGDTMMGGSVVLWKVDCAGWLAKENIVRPGFVGYWMLHWREYNFILLYSPTSCPSK